MSIFHEDDLTKPQSKVYLERLIKVVDDTYDIRQQKISALQTEIKVLTKYLQSMKSAQNSYLAKNRILQDIANKYMGIKGGIATPSPLGADPEYDASYKNSVIMQYADRESVVQNRSLIEGAGTSFTIPEITIASTDLGNRIKDIQKNISRYDHIIKQTRLKIELNRIDIENLQKEKSSIEGGS